MKDITSLLYEIEDSSRSSRKEKELTEQEFSRLCDDLIAAADNYAAPQSPDATPQREYQLLNEKYNSLIDYDD
jgi:hypothetical protein